MTITPTIKVTIGKYTFKKVAEVSVHSSFENLTDTCSLTIAKFYRDRDRNTVAGDGILKVGDAIKVELGYDWRYETVFEGYITRIYPDEKLIRLEAQDEMWKLKQKTVPVTLEKFDLKKVVEVITAATGVKYELTETMKSDASFRLIGYTPAQVLDELRKLYGVYSFFRNKTLYVGLAYVPKLAKRHILREDVNIWPGANLQYAKKEDLKLRIRGISMNGKHGKDKIEVFVGDPDGEVRTFHKRGLTKPALEAYCKKELEKVQYTGYQGSLVTFGVPFVQHGHMVKPVYPRVPDHNGAYYMVKSVEYRVNISEGYVQEVELGPVATGKV